MGYRSKKIDKEKNARYIIERILDLGNDKEVKWMWDHYDKKLIKDVVNNSRSIRKDTRSLRSLILADK
ncbi:MAG: hypothetical protein PHY30_02560 [Candidatus Pacebacteria bacterium]|nr:hypothetical protein [Candidatus Paceibacterota bacterium]